jgi:hypothetical protein
LESGAFGSERSFFFSIRVLLVLAPSRKPTKHEKVILAMLEELSKQFRGFQVGVMARGKNQNMEQTSV